MFQFSVWLRSLGGKKIDNSGSFYKKPFKSFLFLSNRLSNIKRVFFFPTFTSRDKLFFKGPSYFIKNKTKIKIPKVLWDTVVSGYEGNISFKQKKRNIFVHILLESLSSWQLLCQVSTWKYVSVMNVLTDLYLEKYESNAIILSQVHYFIHYFKVYTSIS